MDKKVEKKERRSRAERMSTHNKLQPRNEDVLVSSSSQTQFYQPHMHSKFSFQNQHLQVPLEELSPFQSVIQTKEEQASFASCCVEVSASF